MKWLLFIVLCVTLSYGDETESKCKEYTSENFNDELAKNNHFVMFYAPWCFYCKRLHPTWEELAEMLNEKEGSRITIAKVDCTVESTLCSEHDVTGYPTLKYFDAGKKEGVKFKGSRDLPSLTNFLNTQLGSNLVKKSDDEGTVEVKKVLVELNDENYVNHLSKGNHFVKFYAPWCGHCQRLAPTWDDLASSHAGDDSVTISKIDCTINREACKTYDIKSYPTLLWIQDGSKVDRYQGQRSVEQLSEYITEMVGSAKQPDEPVLPTPPAPVISLSGDDFNEAIKTGITFVKFFAPWCGHCKMLAPTWDELGVKLHSQTDIVVAKVDCTIESNKELCNNEEVEGFPTLLLYKDGARMQEYKGSRSLEDLYEFVSKHLPHDEL